MIFFLASSYDRNEADEEGIHKESKNRNSNDSHKTVFCRYCGGKIYEDAVICPHCGRQVAPLKNNKDVDKTNAAPWDDSNIIGLIIGTVLFPIVGIIAGIYGLIKPGKAGQAVGLLILTTVVSIIWTFILNGCSFY